MKNMIYNINDIYQVRINNSNTNYWLLREKNEYKDFFNNNNLSINKNDITIVKSFSKFLKDNNLETILFMDYNTGNLISKKTFIEILNMYEEIKSLSEEEYDRINFISQTVADKCCFEFIKSYYPEHLQQQKKFLYNVKGLVDKTNFWKLLQQTIKLELIKNRYSDTKLSIGKVGLYVDYKICSVLGYLNIKYSALDFKDFRIEYDYNSIYQYDKNGNCCFKMKLEKIKTKSKKLDNK